jgi:hypothetical protein
VMEKSRVFFFVKNSALSKACQDESGRGNATIQAGR